jgi:hypothetical protein
VCFAILSALARKAANCLYFSVFSEHSENVCEILVFTGLEGDLSLAWLSIILVPSLLPVIAEISEGLRCNLTNSATFVATLNLLVIAAVLEPEKTKSL